MIMTMIIFIDINIIVIIIIDNIIMMMIIIIIIIIVIIIIIIISSSSSSSTTTTTTTTGVRETPRRARGTVATRGATNATAITNVRIQEASDQTCTAAFTRQLGEAPVQHSDPEGASPAPDSVLFELISVRVFFSGGVFFSQTPVL